MANELVIAAEWLSATLTASAALASAAPAGVWSEIAPTGITGVWTRYALQSPGDDQIVVAGDRLFTTPLFQVVVEGQVNDYGTLQAGADAIEAALHDVDGTQGGYSLHSQRERPFALTELKGTEQWRRLGGLYRLYIQ